MADMNTTELSFVEPSNILLRGLIKDEDMVNNGFDKISVFSVPETENSRFAKSTSSTETVKLLILHSKIQQGKFTHFFDITCLAADGRLPKHVRYYAEEFELESVWMDLMLMKKAAMRAKLESEHGTDFLVAMTVQVIIDNLTSYYKAVGIPSIELDQAKLIPLHDIFEKPELPEDWPDN